MGYSDENEVQANQTQESPHDARFNTLLNLLNLKGNVSPYLQRHDLFRLESKLREYEGLKDKNKVATGFFNVQRDGRRYEAKIIAYSNYPDLGDMMIIDYGNGCFEFTFTDTIPQVVTMPGQDPYVAEILGTKAIMIEQYENEIIIHE